VCFVCENDGKEKDLIKGRQCPHCMSRVKLLKPQCILEHVAAHILFDQQIDSASKPCSFCLHPSDSISRKEKDLRWIYKSTTINWSVPTCYAYLMPLHPHSQLQALVLISLFHVHGVHNSHLQSGGITCSTTSRITIHKYQSVIIRMFGKLEIQRETGWRRYGKTGIK
jgi:hypothetical protein